MDTDEPDQYQADAVIDLYHQTVFVAADIENRPIASDKIYGRSELELQIGRTHPSCAHRACIPELERHFRRWMTQPEFAQSPLSNDLHFGSLACSQIVNNRH